MNNQSTKYNQQANRVYTSEMALRSALSRFGFICNQITPAKAFTACAGSWIESLEFKEANFNWELDSETKINQPDPTMILRLNNNPNEIIRLCSCRYGGGGYRIIPDPMTFHKLKANQTN